MFEGVQITTDLLKKWVTEGSSADGLIQLMITVKEMSSSSFKRILWLTQVYKSKLYFACFTSPD